MVKETIKTINLLFEKGLADSKGEAKRLLRTGQVLVNKRVFYDRLIDPEKGTRIRIGNKEIVLK